MSTFRSGRSSTTGLSPPEARGITDARQAVSFGPHPEPELAAMQRHTFQALEVADEQAEIRAMSRGELEAWVLDADRAGDRAAGRVGRLRLTAQAEANAGEPIELPGSGRPGHR